MPSPYKVGQVVSIDDGRSGTIRFIGSTSFRDGEWIGIELSDNSGKNDGSVQGQRYFDCPDGRGLFLQAPKIDRILEQPKPSPKKPVTRPASISAKPGTTTTATSSTAAKRQSIVSNGLKRTSMADPTAAKRQTMNAASPTPSRAAASTSTNGVRASTKPTPKPTTAASVSATRTGTPSTTARRTQTSSLATSRVGSSASPSKPTTTRPSLAAPRPARGSVTSGTASTRTSANRSSISSRAAVRPSSMTSVGSANEEKAGTNEEDSSLKDSTIKEDDAEGSVEKQDEAGAKEDTDLAEAADEQEAVQNEETEDGIPINGHTKQPEKPATRQVTPKVQPTASKANTKPTPSPRPAPAPAASTRSKREEELTKAIELLEKKRAEDRDKLNRFERVMAEKDRYASVIEKLQNKYQPQAKDLQEKTQQLETLEKRIAELQDVQEDHDAALEEAALDRETAEEIAETLRTELEEIKLKAEELQLEVETLRDENDELGKEMSPEERASKGWLQMERENHRLRDALLRLRDMTKEQETELREEITRLEADLTQFQTLQTEYDETKARLAQSESDLAELKDQLEATREGEGMLEELTEKNLALNEEIEELRLSIEHLENIRDLNDEMELAHVENERQLQDELDARDTLVMEHVRNEAQQDERLASYEYTITRFRELVTNLQSHIEEMKATKQISEVESEELTSRSRAMADLNLRLQNSAMKAQVKTVDFELGRLEAQEAVEHLSIMSMFLHDGYKSDKESILTYLRFKRVQFKAELLQGFFKEKQSEALANPTSETTFAISEIMDGFAWITGTANRFVNHISACASDQFAKYSSALYELDPIEKGLNRYIEGWKKAEYKERNIAEELKRSILLLTHLAEVHIDEDPSSFADDVLMRTSMMQNQLENTSTTLNLASKLLEDRKKLIPDDADETEIESFEEILKQLGKLGASTRTAKVAAGKTFNSVRELRDRSMALDTDTLDAFEKPQKHVSDILYFVKSLGELFFEAFENQDKEGASPQSAIDSAMTSLKALPFIDRQDRGVLSVLDTRLQNAIEHLNKLIGVTSELSNASEFQRNDHPWIVHGEALKSSRKTTATAEEENKRLKEDVKERITQLRTRDQTIEEQNVKIEVLESRMKDANAKANRIYELQALVDSGKKREKELTAAIESQLRIAQNLQAERDRWKQVADETKAAGSREAKRSSGERNVGTAKEMEALRRQVRSLQGAVRYLREEGMNGQATKPGTTANLDWLATPLFTKKLPAVKARSEAHGVLLQEGNSIFESLIELVVGADPVDLRKLPQNKLAWRPAKEKTSWVVAHQTEQWGAWCSIRDAYVSKARTGLAAMPKALSMPLAPTQLETNVEAFGMAPIPIAPPSAGLSDENFEDARSEVVVEA